MGLLSRAKVFAWGLVLLSGLSLACLSGCGGPEEYNPGRWDMHMRYISLGSAQSDEEAPQFTAVLEIVPGNDPQAEPEYRTYEISPEQKEVAVGELADNVPYHVTVTVKDSEGAVLRVLEQDVQ